MSRYAVDTDALALAASRIRRAADEARCATDLARGFAPTIALLGDGTLIQAAGGFADAWSYGLRLIAADARRLADALDLLVHLYGDLEPAPIRLLTGASRSGELNRLASGQPAWIGR